VSLRQRLPFQVVGRAGSNPITTRRGLFPNGLRIEGGRRVSLGQTSD